MNGYRTPSVDEKQGRTLLWVPLCLQHSTEYHILRTSRLLCTESSMARQREQKNELDIRITRGGGE
jgi:hypothetical protein